MFNECGSNASKCNAYDNCCVIAFRCKAKLSSFQCRKRRQLCMKSVVNAAHNHRPNSHFGAYHPKTTRQLSSQALKQNRIAPEKCSQQPIQMRSLCDTLSLCFIEEHGTIGCTEIIAFHFHHHPVLLLVYHSTTQHANLNGEIKMPKSSIHRQTLSYLLSRVECSPAARLKFTTSHPYS